MIMYDWLASSEAQKPSQAKVGQVERPSPPHLANIISKSFKKKYVRSYEMMVDICINAGFRHRAAIIRLDAGTYQASSPTM